MHTSGLAQKYHSWQIDEIQEFWKEDYVIENNAEVIEKKFCPKDLSQLHTPTMFLIAMGGFFPSHIKDLYARLPSIKKRLVELDGRVLDALSSN